MKKIFALFASLVFSATLFAQGSILSFETLPASPSVNEPVKVVAHLMFTSGGCEESEQGHTTISTRTDAYAHHCIGFLTVMCPTSDTFDLGILPAGDHVFSLILTTGVAPAPCTPGITHDDMDSLTFTVTPSVGIYAGNKDTFNFSIYPNPASLQLTVESVSHNRLTAVSIYNTLGQLLLQTTISFKRETLNIAGLNSGIYYLHLHTEKGTEVKKFEVIR